MTESFSRLDTWQWTTGGKVLYENCDNCGGLMVEFRPNTVKQYGIRIRHPHFIACTSCETPAEVAARIDSTGERMMGKLTEGDY